MKFKIAKHLIALVWLMVIVNLFYPFPGVLAPLLFWTGAFMVVVHVAEFVFFFKTISQKPESLPVSFIMTFLFGLFYFKARD